MCGAVRIILDALDAASQTKVVTLEINHAVQALVAATTVEGRDPPIVITATALFETLGQAALRVPLVQIGLTTAT